MVRISNNAQSAKELEGVLDDASDVLGLPTEPGSRILLESGQPPFEIIVDVSTIISALGTIFVGAAKCSELYKKLRNRIRDRRVQIVFSAPGRNRKTLLYPVSEDTPNEAIVQIASDSTRDVSDRGAMRFWVDEGWMTYEEFETLQLRKQS